MTGISSYRYLTWALSLHVALAPQEFALLQSETRSVPPKTPSRGRINERHYRYRLIQRPCLLPYRQRAVISTNFLFLKAVRQTEEGATNGTSHKPVKMTPGLFNREKRTVEAVRWLAHSKGSPISVLILSCSFRIPSFVRNMLAGNVAFVTGFYLRFLV